MIRRSASFMDIKGSLLEISLCNALNKKYGQRREELTKNTQQGGWCLPWPWSIFRSRLSVKDCSHWSFVATFFWPMSSFGLIFLNDSTSFRMTVSYLPALSSKTKQSEEVALYCPNWSIELSERFLSVECSPSFSFLGDKRHHPDLRLGLTVAPQMEDAMVSTASYRWYRAAVCEVAFEKNANDDVIDGCRWNIDVYIFSPH